jgi:predicted ATPase
MEAEMLTRLKVTGFKNLIDTEIRFGPLTCIAGLNGMGKSNIFDAVQFLSKLADQPFVEAARATRGGSEIVDLFTVGGDGTMSFECDMLIPSQGKDDFHQPADASQTFLTYFLKLRLDRDPDELPRVKLENERLTYVPASKAKKQFGFDHTKNWRESVVQTSHRRVPFIETENEGDDRIVRLSSDKMRDETKSQRGGGRPTDFLARNLPRTVLSAAQNAEEARTSVLTRVEMRSWRILQLEPSALRHPDDLQAPSSLGSDGKHLPATLYRLASQGNAERIYAEVANRLSELVDDVRRIRVDRDDTRRVLRLVLTDRNGVELPASSLSDGTLRFVALAVLERDPTATGLICLEEPENGIHPDRMDAMMGLLKDMAVSPEYEVGPENPLRQVIVSTHSPVVAARARRDELLFAEHIDAQDFPPGQIRGLIIRPIDGTWRDRGNQAVARGEILHYFDAVRPKQQQDGAKRETVFAHFQEQLQLPYSGER